MWRLLMGFVLLVALSYGAMVAFIPTIDTASDDRTIEGRSAAERLSSEAALTIGAHHPRDAQADRAGP